MNILEKIWYTWLILGIPLSFFAWLAWILYAGLILTSPWVVVPYSDSVGLFMPLSIFYLYISMKGDKCDIIRWMGIALLSYWGFRVKPQILIVAIAIIIIEGSTE